MGKPFKFKMIGVFNKTVQSTSLQSFTCCEEYFITGVEFFNCFEDSINIFRMACHRLEESFELKKHIAVILKQWTETYPQDFVDVGYANHLLEN